MTAEAVTWVFAKPPSLWARTAGTVTLPEASRAWRRSRAIDAVEGGESGDAVYRVAQNGGVLWWADATDALWEFARRCALEVAHMWTARDFVLEYLRTGNDTLRELAYDDADCSEKFSQAISLSLMRHMPIDLAGEQREAYRQRIEAEIREANAAKAAYYAAWRWGARNGAAGAAQSARRAREPDLRPALRDRMNNELEAALRSLEPSK